MANIDPATSNQRDDAVVGVPHHPVATGVGAAAAGATGALVGSVAGPVGTVVGALVGAVIGGLGGDAIASAVGEARDAAYWRENYANRPYAKPGRSYEDYGPAYAHGETARQRHGHRDFDSVAPELEQEWRAVRGNSLLEWEDARPAAHDAWTRWPGGAQDPGR